MIPPTIPDRFKFDQLEQESKDNNNNNNNIIRDNNLINWLKENGATFDKLHLREYAPEVRGVHTVLSIEPNETVLTIPLNCLITVEMGKNTLLGKLILPHIDYFCAPKHIFLMIYILIDMENTESSFFKYYYKSLPLTLSNIPIFWDENQLKWLNGSHIRYQIEDRKKSIQMDYYKICSIDSNFSRFSLEQFTWAKMIVASRNFGLLINGIRTAALVPLADMLNHYRPRETSWMFNNEENCFIITSLRSIPANSQIYDSYGKKCNHRFLLNYGFAIENNIEEDGLNPNEVMAYLNLEPVHDTKDIASDSLLILKKKMYLENECDVQSMHTRMNCRYSESTTKEGFSYCRLIVATESEFSIISDCYDAYSIPPISISNEQNVLLYLKRLMIEQLSRYETTLEEDNRLLKEKKYPLFSNRYHSLVFMQGEKVVCHHYIKLADEMINLLNMKWPECRDILKSKYDSDDDISLYVQDVVLYLLKKTFNKNNEKKESNVFHSDHISTSEYGFA